MDIDEDMHIPTPTPISSARVLSTTNSPKGTPTSLGHISASPQNPPSPDSTSSHPAKKPEGDASILNQGDNIIRTGNQIQKPIPPSSSNSQLAKMLAQSYRDLESTRAQLASMTERAEKAEQLVADLEESRARSLAKGKGRAITDPDTDQLKQQVHTLQESVEQLTNQLNSSRELCQEYELQHKSALSVWEDIEGFHHTQEEVARQGREMVSKHFNALFNGATRQDRKKALAQTGTEHIGGLGSGAHSRHAGQPDGLASAGPSTRTKIASTRASEIDQVLSQLTSKPSSCSPSCTGQCSKLPSKPPVPTASSSVGRDSYPYGPEEKLDVSSYLSLLRKEYQAVLPSKLDRTTYPTTTRHDIDKITTLNAQLESLDRIMKDIENGVPGAAEKYLASRYGAI